MKYKVGDKVRTRSGPAVDVCVGIPCLDCPFREIKLEEKLLTQCIWVAITVINE